MHKKILNLALPAMGEQLLQMAMGAMDSYLVAQLGLVAVAGVSVANNVMSIYQAVFIGLATATSSLLASQKDQDPRELMGQSLSLTLLVGGLLGLLALGFGQHIFSALGLRGETRAVAQLYLGLVGGFSCLLGLMNTLSGLLRVLGRPRLPLLVSILANALNLLLSASFLYLTPLGLTGVALGTVLSRLIGVCLLYLFLPEKPQLSDFRPRQPKLLHLSLPLIGERLMMRAGDVVVVGVVVSLGSAVVAGQALGESLIQFSFLPAMGMATATVILVAQEQEDLSRLPALIWASYLLTIGLMLVTSFSIWFFGQDLLSLYTSNQAVIDLAKILLLMALIDIPVTAGTQILAASWQGLGRPRLPFYATTVGMWLVRVVGTYCLSVQLGLGLWGVALSTALDNLWRTLFLALTLTRFFKKNKSNPALSESD